MPATKAERVEIERQVHERIMRSLDAGDMLLMGHRLDELVAGIHNMKALVPGNLDARLREIVRLKAADALLEAAQAAFPWIDSYDDHMGPEDFDKREAAQNALSEAITAYKNVAPNSHEGSGSED